VFKSETYTGYPVRLYRLDVEGDLPPGQKPVFCRFIYKLKKIIKNHVTNENKMSKGQSFQKNKLYNIIIANFIIFKI